MGRTNLVSNHRAKDLVSIVTWNCANYARGCNKEAVLSSILVSGSYDVAIVTETDLSDGDGIYVGGYSVLYASPCPSGKRRLAALVRDSISATVISRSHMDIVVRLDLPSPVYVVGLYRQWSDCEPVELFSFHSRCASLKHDRVLIIGDANLDTARIHDPTYTRRSLLLEHLRVMEEELGLLYVGPYSPTYFSFGTYGGSQRRSTIDHVYARGISSPSVRVLSDSTTDHRPVAVCFPAELEKERLSFARRRVYGRMDAASLCLALEGPLRLVDVYSCGDVDVIYDKLVWAINRALDSVAPYRSTAIRPPTRPPLYLAEDTKQAMRARDRLAASGSPSSFRAARNLANRLVRRDRVVSAQKAIASCGEDQRKLWQLAGTLLGDSGPKLPKSMHNSDGNVVEGNTALANVVNNFFVDKVSKIQHHPAGSPHPSSRDRALAHVLV